MRNMDLNMGYMFFLSIVAALVGYYLDMILPLFQEQSDK